MLEIINKKTISFTTDKEAYREISGSPLFYRTFIRQGDFCFGENNWYATKIYQQKNEDESITFFMEIKGDI